MKKTATIDASDFQDDASAEAHAKAESEKCDGFIAVNVHPMSDSPYVHYQNGQEIWRATGQQIKTMREEGIRILRAERRAERGF